jgi:phosphoglycolate phosphatase
MLKLIIFDYDGVIVDSFQNCHEVYKIMCKKLGKKCPESLEEFKKIYGHSSSECYRNLGIPDEDRAKGDAIYKEEILKKEPKVFDGIIDVLRALHGRCKLALLSASYREELEQKTRKFGIHDLFYSIIGRESDPAAHLGKIAAIIKLMNDLVLKPDEILSIGDRNVDFIDGTRAGIKNILLVDYGWGYNPEEIPEYNQKFIVKEPSDILAAVEKF